MSKILKHAYQPHTWICSNCNRAIEDVNLALGPNCVICPFCKKDTVMPEATYIITALEDEVDELKSELDKAHGVISVLMTKE